MESEDGEKGMVEFYQSLTNRQKTEITEDQIDGTVEKWRITPVTKTI